MGHTSVKIHEYLILEYHTCHQKVSSAVEHLIRIELYIFLAISAVYAWFYGAIGSEHPPSERIRLALYLPPLLACLAWYRSSMQLRYIDAIARYLMLVEKGMIQHVSTEDRWEYVGWENWFAQNGPRTWNRSYRILLWPGLICVTLVVAYFGIGLPSSSVRASSSLPAAEIVIQR